MKQKTFSVLGCGWLGLPLAKAFVKNNFIVKGTTTTVAKCELLLEQGIQPYVLTIDDSIDGNITHFLQADILFINIPFRKQKPFLNTYKKLIAQIESANIEHVIFISSTSVYADTNKEIKETEPFVVNPEKKELLDFENLFLNNKNFNTTIIRFAGLIGGTRNPGNFFKADRIVQNALMPVNLIHLEDCIGIIQAIVAQQKWNTVYNAAAETHPTKAEYYRQATLNMDKEPATFLKELNSYKIINSQKAISELNYTFLFSDLLDSLKQFN